MSQDLSKLKNVEAYTNKHLKKKLDKIVLTALCIGLIGGGAYFSYKTDKENKEKQAILGSNEGFVEYVIEKGESLDKIAREHNPDPDKITSTEMCKYLMKLNEIKPSDYKNLQKSRKIRVPNYYYATYKK